MKGRRGRDDRRRRGRGRADSRDDFEDEKSSSSSSAGSTSERDNERFKNRPKFGAVPKDEAAELALAKAVVDKEAGILVAGPVVSGGLAVSQAKSLQGEVEFSVGDPGSENTIFKEFLVEALHLGNSAVARKDTLEKIAKGHGVAMTLVRDGMRHRLRVQGIRAKVEAAAQGVHIRVEGARRELAYNAKTSQLASVTGTAMISQTPLPAAYSWTCGACHEGQAADAIQCFKCHAPRPGNEQMTNTDVIRVDQRYIGYVLGKNGTFFKALEAHSGAKIHLDKGNEFSGYSTILIGGVGTPEHQKARFMLMNKLEEAMESCKRKGPR